VDAEHILLALTCESGGRAILVLQALGVDVERLKNESRQALGFREPAC
jgi:Clp amino terminal domain, pathogenicity island component